MSPAHCGVVTTHPFGECPVTLDHGVAVGERVSHGLMLR